MLLGILILFRVRAILGPFFLAFVLAYLLNPLVVVLERYKISRNRAIAIVFILIIAFCATAIFLIIPIIYNELTKLLVILPQTIQSITDMIEEFRNQFKATGLPNRVAIVLDEHLIQGETMIADRLNQFLDNLPKALSSVTLYMLSPVIAIYFLADWKGLGEGFFGLSLNAGGWNGDGCGKTLIMSLGNLYEEIYS